MARIVHLSEAASIALHAMILIMRSKKKMNVIQIAERTDSSKHHVAKVLQLLVKQNYLDSHRGPTGGFILKKNADQITFLELYEAIEGKIEITSCPLDKQICAFDKCIMNNITKQMTIQFRDYLKSQVLSEYANDEYITTR